MADTLLENASLRTCIAALESQLASGNRYPHMCRMDHEEIGHRDSSEERCPMCRMRDEYESKLAQYRWRRVEEEMPDPYVRVLARGYCAVVEAYYTRTSWYAEDGGMMDAPTHWMPLPPAPEGGE